MKRPTRDDVRRLLGREVISDGALYRAFVVFYAVLAVAIFAYLYSTHRHVERERDEHVRWYNERMRELREDLKP